MSDTLSSRATPWLLSDVDRVGGGRVDDGGLCAKGCRYGPWGVWEEEAPPGLSQAGGSDGGFGVR